MTFKQGHALLIGVGTHAHGAAKDVPITVADAQAVKDVLVDEDACGFLEANIDFLHDQQATKQNILDHLKKLAERVSPTDTALIFYCGHGARGVDGNYYLVPHDAKTVDKKIEPTNGIATAELTEALGQINAQKVLMIFNACHSGHIGAVLGEVEQVDPELKTQNPAGDDLKALLATGEGRVIIVAAKKKQYSVIGPGPLTYFTTALVNGLEGEGVRNNGGYIDVYDLYQKIYRDVQQAVKKWGEAYNQEPLLTCLDIAGSFPVALYQGANPEALTADYQPDPLPAEGNVEAVAAADAERAYRKYFHIGSVGDNSTVAQGDGAVAVGNRGVYVGGKNTGVVITGDENIVGNSNIVTKLKN